MSLRLEVAWKAILVALSLKLFISLSACFCIQWEFNGKILCKAFIWALSFVLTFS
jgi:hypothetical protein